MEQQRRGWLLDTLEITSQERVQLHISNMVCALGITRLSKLDQSHDMLLQYFEMYAVHNVYFQKIPW